MFIPDPWSWFLPIPDSGSNNSNKTEGWKKFVFMFFYGHKCHKIVNYFIFEMLRKKNLGQFQKIIEFFPQKFVTNLSKVWVWDPGSRIRNLGSKRHRIPDPQHWQYEWILILASRIPTTTGHIRNILSTTIEGSKWWDQQSLHTVPVSKRNNSKTEE